MRKLIIYCIHLYQHIFSPDKGILRGLYAMRGACAMYPTCSEYAILSIEKYGVIKGVPKSILRITRCHPFQRTLVDPP